MDKHDTGSQSSRRDFLKKAAYVAPAVLTLNAMPAFATHGSKPPVCDRPKPDFSDKFSKFRDHRRNQYGPLGAVRNRKTWR